MTLKQEYLEGLTSTEQEKLKKYISILHRVAMIDDPATCIQTPVVTKYNLNRVRHNDPTMTSFYVNMMNEDPGLSGNELAKELLSALKNNTHLKKIGITYTPLKDEFFEPLFNLLKDRSMDFVDFSGTDLTDKTIAPLIYRFVDKNQPRWNQLFLKNIIAGYKGIELADIADIAILENKTNQLFVFEPETPDERNKRLVRFIKDRKKLYIPTYKQIKIRER